MVLDQEKQRDNFWDLIKCLAVFFVILIHNPISDEIMYRKLYTVAVPLFLCISGYLFSQNNLSYSRFIIKKAKRILIPYILWSLFYSIIYHQIDISIGGGISLLGGRAWFPLYYLPLLFQFMILAPVLRQRKIQYLFILGLTPMFLLFSYTYRALGFEVSMDIFRLFWPWSAFFAFGIYMKDKEISIRIENLMFLFFIVLIISMSESETIMQLIGHKNLATGQNTITSTLMVLLMFTICVKISRMTKPLGSNIATKMGRYSFGIYLLHGFVGSLVYRVLHFLHTDCSLILLAANFIILTVCFVSVLIIEKILPAKFIKYVGLK